MGIICGRGRRCGPLPPAAQRRSSGLGWRVGHQHRRDPRLYRRVDRTHTSPALTRRLDDLDDLLAKHHDQPKAHYLLLEAQTLLQEISTSKGPDHYLRPPWAEFEQDLADFTRLLERLEVQDPESAREFQERWSMRRAKGQLAYQDLDQTTWRQVNNELKDDIGDLVRKSSAAGIRTGLSPAQIQEFLRGRLDELTDLVRTRYEELTHDDRLGPEARAALPRQRDDYLTTLTAIGLSIDSVDLTSVTAHEQLVNRIYHGQLRPLEESVKKWGPIGLQ